MLLRTLPAWQVRPVTLPPAVRPHMLPSLRGFTGYNNLPLQVSGRRDSLFGLKMEALNVDKLRSDFIQVLRSRRSGDVPLSVELTKPVTDPMYQGGSSSPEVMESCPKVDIIDFKDRLVEENLYLITEGGEQGRLPVLILSMKDSKEQKRPAVVFLHSSYKAKEWLRPLLEAYASRGYVAVAIDSRYHGERASSKTTYIDALVSSWRNADTMPFIFDTVWDLIKLADYLTQREDIDSSRIGITGESLGGMHAWFAAFADSRYAVVAPIIGVQGFRWAIDNDEWQARVDSIKPVFEARIDFGKSAIDKDVVEKVWTRIAPGLAAEFDSPYTVPAIAPRPFVIINGEEDPRCPLPGLNIPISKAEKAYKDANCSEKFKVVAQPGIGHQITSLMVKEASDWFDRFLK
ncbi:uncharacterized protein [Aristolochia californica]|uniref:uncharacterized protein isoform X2 n=1 Tax=Aristolochia californica TaxID=171875 RepID=UPI0035E29F31